MTLRPTVVQAQPMLQRHGVGLGFQLISIENNNMQEAAGLSCATADTI
jgi:hypothetical protein